jgi:hypothetical protein
LTPVSPNSTLEGLGYTCFFSGEPAVVLDGYLDIAGAVGAATAVVRFFLPNLFFLAASAASAFFFFFSAILAFLARQALLTLLYKFPFLMTSILCHSWYSNSAW